MADLERSTAAAPAAATAQHTQTDIEGLPALFGRLGEDVMTLLDTKLSLAKVELKEDVAGYARGATITSAGVVVAVIGFALINVAVALFLSTFFGNDEASAAVQKYGPSSYGLGFLITGVIYLVIGGVLAYVGKNRLAARNPVPNRSVEELRKDKQWLKNEM
ncbi:MAG: phage holin family protein [Pyrinomonadaceae bacterium]|nr:phage holin family protein [Pyrinomonadaceae bacterium]